jgi:hypothetical protein
MLTGVGLVGADDMLSENYVQRHLDGLTAQPSAPCAYGRVSEFGTRSGYWSPGTYQPGYIWRTNTIPGCAIWRPFAWHDLQGFDERFTQGFEDWHFAARAEARGILTRFTPPAFVPEAIYYHRARADSLTDRMPSDYDQWARNEIAALFPPPSPPRAPLPEPARGPILSGPYALDCP